MAGARAAAASSCVMTRRPGGGAGGPGTAPAAGPPPTGAGHSAPSRPGRGRCGRGSRAVAPRGSSPRPAGPPGHPPRDHPRAARPARAGAGRRRPRPGPRRPARSARPPRARRSHPARPPRPHGPGPVPPRPAAARHPAPPRRCRAGGGAPGAGRCRRPDGARAETPPQRRQACHAGRRGLRQDALCAMTGVASVRRRRSRRRPAARAGVTLWAPRACWRATPQRGRHGDSPLGTGQRRGRARSRTARQATWPWAVAMPSRSARGEGTCSHRRCLTRPGSAAVRPLAGLSPAVTRARHRAQSLRRLPWRSA
jgi:hypothetical protein